MNIVLIWNIIIIISTSISAPDLPTDYLNIFASLPTNLFTTQTFIKNAILRRYLYRFGPYCFHCQRSSNSSKYSRIPHWKERCWWPRCYQWWCQLPIDNILWDTAPTTKFLSLLFFSGESLQSFLLITFGSCHFVLFFFLFASILISRSVYYNYSCFSFHKHNNPTCILCIVFYSLIYLNVL